MGYHARLGPSSAYRWSTCTAAPGAEDGKPNDGNDASRAGTAEHQASAECLEHGLDPWSYLGRVMLFNGRKNEWRTADSQRGEFEVTLDDAAIQRIEAYVRLVLDMAAAQNAVMFIEQRVPIDFITGEGYWDLNGDEVPEGTPGAVWSPAGGTSDAVLLTAEEIIVIDAKFGQKRVTAWDCVRPAGIDPVNGTPVEAIFAPNKQMAMYAAGTLHKFGWMAPTVKRVRMIIVQPKLSATSEHVITLDELNSYVNDLRIAAHETRDNPTYRPSEDACGFCRARLTCAARETHVLSSVLDGFVSGDVNALAAATVKQVDGNWLGVLYEKLDMLKGFIADVHIRVFHALKSEQPVIGENGEAYKLVEGRPGHRKWSDPAAVEFLVTTELPADLAFDKKLISPARVEELATAKRAWRERPAIPAKVTPQAWDALQSFIQQDKGQASIVPGSDPRPAIKPSTDGFSDISVSHPVENDLFS
ncbi:MAG: DUF2800 domain-containing protein [Rhodocyclaceae bacterium]|nr:DUF2800 domain-containing protein [Rhodocyclaceae bacterium]